MAKFILLFILIALIGVKRAQESNGNGVGSENGNGVGSENGNNGNSNGNNGNSKRPKFSDVKPVDIKKEPGSVDITAVNLLDKAIYELNKRKLIQIFFFPSEPKFYKLVEILNVLPVDGSNVRFFVSLGKTDCNYDITDSNFCNFVDNLIRKCRIDMNFNSNYYFNGNSNKPKTFAGIMPRLNLSCRKNLI